MKGATMQIGTNFYFNLQNYSDNFKSRDSQKTFGEMTEAQNAPFNEATNERESQNTDITAPEAPNGEKLDSSEQQYVRELAVIDASVRAHEAAHIGAGGGVVSGGATFGYTRGPDGKMYATSGEVPISMKEGKTPEETIQNARQIVSAAMAPADPSPQDYKVAANAAQMEAQARSEQAAERTEEIKQQTEGSTNTQDSQGSDSKTSEDSVNRDLANMESKNTSDTQERKPFIENTLAAYAIKSYTANAASNSYIPRLDIAG